MLIIIPIIMMNHIVTKAVILIVKSDCGDCYPGCPLHSLVRVRSRLELTLRSRVEIRYDMMRNDAKRCDAMRYDVM
jgi:hypothetical protein